MLSFNIDREQEKDIFIQQTGLNYAWEKKVRFLDF